MKKFFVALSCCLLMATSVIAQDVQSVIEAPDSEVVLASAQDTPPPAATTTAAPAPAAQDPAPAPVVAPAAEIQSSATDVSAPPTMTIEGPASMTIEGSASVMNSGCGCGSTVQSYAAPMTYSAPMAHSAQGCCAPVAADCCQPRRSFQRPYRVSRMMGRRCCN